MTKQIGMGHVPSLAELQQRIAVLEGRVAALTATVQRLAKELENSRQEPGRPS